MNLIQRIKMFFSRKKTNRKAKERTTESKKKELIASKKSKKISKPVKLILEQYFSVLKTVDIDVAEQTKKQLRAVVELSKMGKEAIPAIPILIETLLDSRLEDIRSASKVALKIIDSQYYLNPLALEKIPLLVRRLGNSRTNKVAAGLLIKMGKQANEPLLEYLKKDIGKNLEIEIIKVLSAIKPQHPEVIKLIKVRSKNTEKRKVPSKKISNPVKSILEQHISVLKTIDTNVVEQTKKRVRAVVELSKMEKQAIPAIPILIETLLDSSFEDVRSASKVALKIIEAQYYLNPLALEKIPFLVKRLGNSRTNKAAAGLLIKMGKQANEPLLEYLKNDIRKNLEIEIIKVLSAIKPQHPEVIKLISERSKNIEKRKVPNREIIDPVMLNLAKQIKGLNAGDINKEAQAKKRVMAAVELSKMGKQAIPAIPILIEKLLDSNIADIRRASRMALERIEAQYYLNPLALEKIPFLVKRLGDNRANKVAAGLLTKMGKQANEPLIQYLKKDIDEDIEVKIIKVLSAIKPQHPETIKLIIERVKNSENREIREAAIRAIGNLDLYSNDILNLIVERIGAKSSGGEKNSVYTRKAIFETLRKFGAASLMVLPRIINCLGDDKAEIRKEAIDTIVQIGPSTIPYLLEIYSKNEGYKEEDIKDLFERFKKLIKDNPSVQLYMDNFQKLATHVKLDSIDNQCIIFLLRGRGSSSIFLIIYSNKGSKVILLPNNR